MRGHLVKGLVVGLIVLSTAVDVGAVCHTTQTVGINLDAGWSMVSLPLAPVDPDPAVIFAGATVTNSLYEYDRLSGYLIYPGDFTQMSVGVGYWLYLDTPGSFSYDGVAARPLPQVPFVLSGWHLIGHIEDDIESFFDKMLATPESIATSPMLFPDAVSAGWLQDPMFYYDGGYQPAGVIPGEDEFMRPGKAYWALAFDSGIVFHPEFCPSRTQIPAEKRGTATDALMGVYVHSGEFEESRTLLSLWGRAGLHWDFTITYRSGIIYDGPLGKGWDFNQNTRLIELRYSGDVLLYDGYGREDLYTHLGGGAYETPRGSYDVLEQDPAGGWTLTDTNAIVTRYDADGLVESITHRSGNAITYQRCPVCGRLTSVTDTLGRVVLFDWDTTTNRLNSVTDPEGRAVTFTYDLNGCLASYTLPPTPDQPGGSTWSFTYSSGYTEPWLNDNLLTIEDAKGQVFVENTYDLQDRVETQRYGPPTAVAILLYWPGTTSVLDHDGYQVDYDYDVNTGLVYQSTLHTGAVNPADPLAYVWQREHNADCELTRLIFPEGNSIERVFDQANPDVRARGNLLEVSNVSHIPGEPPLLTTYTYEPLYNMPRTATDTRGQTTRIYYDYEEASLGDLNGDGDTTAAFGNAVLAVQPTCTLGLPAPQPIERRYWYDADSNLIRQIEPDGEIIVYDHWTSGPGDGMLRYVISDFGGLNLTEEYGYNARGDNTWYTDAGGNTYTYDVNDLGQVIREIKPAPFFYETENHYDANGCLVSEAVQNVDENGVLDPTMPWIETTYTYDVLDHPTSMTQQVSAAHFVTTNYQYNVEGLLTWVEYPEGNREAWVYDERDLLYQHTRGLGSLDESTETYTHDGNRNLILHETDEGSAYTSAYDGYNRLVRSFDAVGNEVIVDYDGLELTSSITHTDGMGGVLRRREFSYDECGRLYRQDMLHNSSIGLPVGDGWSTMTWERDQGGRPLVKTYDDGGSMVAAYDGVGRITSSTRSVAGHDNSYIFTYDHLGNITSETRHFYDPVAIAYNDRVTTRDYDELGRCVREEIGAPGTEYYDYLYNSRDLLVWERNAMGTEIGYSYDGLERRIETRCDAPTPHDVLGVVWDDNGRPVEQYDANGNGTLLTFDELDRPTRVDYADGSVRLFTYDGDDRLVERINPTGTVEVITPNHAGYPLHIDIIPGPGVEGEIEFNYTYDALNRLISGQTVDGLGPLTGTSWHFDTLSNLEAEEQWTRDAPWGAVAVANAFDGCGNKLSMTYPSGVLVECGYDEWHRMTEIWRGGIKLFDVQYMGRKPVSRTAPSMLTEFSYDERHLTQEVVHRDLGLVVQAGFSYARDALGRKQYEHRIQDLKGDAYHYDEMNEFVGAKYGVPNLDPSLDYGDYVIYDSDYELLVDNGQNRMGVFDNGTFIGYNTPTGPYVADPMNRYYWIDGVNRMHDANGNLTDDGTFGYGYNSRNLLSSVSTLGGPLKGYVRDCVGRLVCETNAAGMPETFLYYSGEHCIEERPAIAGPVTTYIWGQQLNNLLLMNVGGTDYFCHENEQGSICLVTDAVGQKVEKIEYEACGEPHFFQWTGFAWASIAQSGIGLDFLFTGQRYDPDTGLYDYRTRTYDPETGRYLQPDGELGLWEQYNNRYTCADSSNDPVNHVSPMGTGGWIDTHSWTSGEVTPSEPYWEHINLCCPRTGQPYIEPNKTSIQKTKEVKYDKKKRGNQGCKFGWADLNPNDTDKHDDKDGEDGISVKVEKQGDTYEVIIHFRFTIGINLSKVCKTYKEKDPKIYWKRKKAGKPTKAHVTEDYINDHEMQHVQQMMDLFDQVIQQALQNLDVKTDGFPGQLEDDLKKALKKWKEGVHEGYPYSEDEREARQKAWDEHDKREAAAKAKKDNKASKSAGNTASRKPVITPSPKRPTTTKSKGSK